MTMPYPPPRKDKPPKNANAKHASLAVRINRAANELNPFLLVLAVGLLILNLTFYLGMSISQHPAAAATSHATGYTASGGAASAGPQLNNMRN